MQVFIDFMEQAAHNTLIKIVAIAIICDTIFGVIRAIKEKHFNSCAGIDGAIRKISMVFSLAFMLLIDTVIQINLIGFLPTELRSYLGMDVVGVADFFAILYISYELVSILKNMTLCGLPTKRVWDVIRKALNKYTDELPDADELAPVKQEVAK